MVSYKIMIDGIHIMFENKCIILNKNPLSDGVFSANLIKTLEEINKKIKII